MNSQHEAFEQSVSDDDATNDLSKEIGTFRTVLPQVNIYLYK